MNLPDLESERPPELVLTRRAKRRLLGAALTLLGMITLTYVLPPLEELQPWRPGGNYVPFWNITARPQSDEEERAEREELASFEELAMAAEASPPSRSESEDEGAIPVIDIDELSYDSQLYPAYGDHPDDSRDVAVPIENAPALDYYFGQLTLTDLKIPGAITRAGHWGDSVLGGDGLTFALRQKMQGRFGDAGHGFHAMSKYSVGYGHRGVRFQDRGGWRSCEIIFKCRPDSRYGYAGVSSISSGGGDSTWQTAKQPPGDRMSRFELWYAKAPDGGRLQVKIDAEEPRIIDTRGERLEDAVEVFRMEDGAHNVQVRAIGNGPVRGYGVVLERDVPGVVWDELSLIGSFTQRLDYQDPAHIAWQLQRRDVDLMVFMFGGNDVQREYEDLKTTMRPYEAEYSRVIQKFRAGKPETSCLVMSLIDHGMRDDDTIRTRAIVPRLVSSQRKVATTEGCAFFDTYRAMGGFNSIARWFRARPQLAAPDFSHPTAAGQAVIATLVYRALMKEYAAFRRRKAGELLPTLATYGESAAAP